MGIKTIYRILFFSLVAVMLMGQTAHKTKKVLIEEAIEEKMLDYIKTVTKKCDSDVQKRAIEIVDSLLVKEAQVKTVDTVKRPPTPPKPNKPAERVAKDTSLVEPLFDQ